MLSALREKETTFFFRCCSFVLCSRMWCILPGSRIWAYIATIEKMLAASTKSRSPLSRESSPFRLIEYTAIAVVDGWWHYYVYILFSLPDGQDLNRTCLILCFCSSRVASIEMLKNFHSLLNETAHRMGNYHPSHFAAENFDGFLRMWSRPSLR